MDLSIIIVNHNSTKYMKRAAASLLNHLNDLKFEIIVVDNSSQPIEQKEAKEYFSKEHFIFLSVPNKGFGAANNSGAKIAEGKILFFLNPDTLIVDDSISKLLKVLEANKKIGALSPLIFGADGKSLQYHFYGNFLSLHGIILKKWQGKEIDLNQDINYVDMVTGASLMIKKDLFNKVGGFDENFFMYAEDDDLCRRIQNLGYKNAVYTKAKIIHFEGKSSSGRDKKLMYYRSQNYYWRKHYGLVQAVLMRIIRWPYKTAKLFLSK